MDLPACLVGYCGNAGSSNPPWLTKTEKQFAAFCGPLWKLALCLALTALASTGCYSPFETGLEALERGDYSTAEAEALFGLAEEPQSEALHYLLAEALYGLGDYGQAANHAQQSLLGDGLEEPYRGPAHLIASDSFAQTGFPVEAALHALKAYELEVWRNDESLRERIALGADSALESGRPGDALVLLRAYRELDREAGGADPPHHLDEMIFGAAEASVEQLMELHQYREAIELIDELRAEFPHANYLIYLRAVVLLRLGHLNEAGATFEAYASAPDDLSEGERFRRAAEAAAELQLWDRAIGFLQRSIELDPDQGDTYVELAEAYFVTSRPALALSVLEDYLDRLSGQLTPDDVISSAYVSAYETALGAGHSDEAIDLLERGHRQLHDFHLTVLLAEALLRRNQSAQADTLVREFVDDSPNPADSAEAVGDWYFDRGNASAATTYFRESTTLAEPTAERLFKLARAYGAIDWAFELVSTLDNYVTLLGGTPEARLTAADLLTAHQQWSDAARILAPLHLESPNDEAIVRLLGECYYYSGQAALEIEVYQTLAAESADSGPIDLRSGIIFFERGVYRDALPWLESASQNPSSRGEALLLMGRIRQRLGETDLMWAAFDAYIELAEDTMAAYATVLTVIEESANITHAATLLRRMLALDPSENDLRLQLAEYLLRGELAEEAVDAYGDFIQNADNPNDAARSAIWSIYRLERLELGTFLMANTIEAFPEVNALLLTTADLYIDLAQEARMEGDLDNAVAYSAVARSHYQAYLETTTDSAIALGQAASQMRFAEFHDLAATAYQRAVDAGLGVEQLRTAYGLSLIEAGLSTDRATDLLSAAIRSSDEPFSLAIDAAEILVDHGELEEAMSLIEVAGQRARTDSERERLYRTAAEFLLSDGQGEQLLSLSNAFVSQSEDQLSALQTSASFLARAGRFRDARGYIELALTLAPNQQELTTALARMSYAEGNIEATFASFEAVASETATPWRTWWQFGRFFSDHRELEHANRAFQAAYDAGGTAAELLVDLGWVQTLLGDAESAHGLFDEASYVSRTTPTSQQDRRSLIERIVNVLSSVGRHDLADVYLAQTLVDHELRAHFLLPAAQRAFQRGNGDRGRQLIRAFLEGGGSLDEVISTELEAGLETDPLNRIGREILEGDAIVGQRLLEQYAQPIADLLGPETLRAWIQAIPLSSDELRPLWAALARAWIRRGEAEHALSILDEIASDDDAWLLPTAVLFTAAGDPSRSLAPYETASTATTLNNSDDLQWGLALLGTLGAGPTVEEFSQLLAAEHSSAAALLARAHWLLSYRRLAEALEICSHATLRARWVEPDDLVVDPSRFALEIADVLARFGLFSEALRFTESETIGFSTPDRRLLSAIRFSLASGDDGSGQDLTEQYLQLGAGHVPSTLALVRMFVESGYGGQAFDVIVPMAASNPSATVERQLLALAARAAILNGEMTDFRNLVDAVGDLRGRRFERLVVLGEQSESIYDWQGAADHWLAAHALAPGQPEILRDTFRVLLRLGAWDQLSGLLGRQTYVDGGSPNLLEDLWAAETTSFDAAEMLQLQQTALQAEPARFEHRVRLMRSQFLAGQIDAAQISLAELDGLLPDEPLNRQSILHSLVGLDHPSVTDFAVGLLDGPEVDPISLGLAAQILADAGDAEHATVAISLMVDRSINQRQAAENGAQFAYELELYELSATLAQQAIDEHGATAVSRPLLLAALIRLDLTTDPLDLSELDGLSPDALSLIARAYLDQGDTVAAEGVLLALAQCMEISEEGRILLTGLGQTLELFSLSNQAEAGIQFVDTHVPGLRIFPSTTGNPASLAALLLGTDQPDAALDVIARSLENSPRDSDMLTQLAFVLASEDGMLEQAENLARLALAYSGSLRADTFGLLGWIHYLQGNSDQGRQELSQAIRLASHQNQDSEILLERMLLWLNEM